MTTPNFETSSTPVTFEICAADDESPTRLVGHAALFNTLSKDQGGFRNLLHPGAFTKTLREKPDIKALWNHNNDLILGRTTAGTLSVEEDDRGLRFELTPPDSPLGQDATASISRGDVTQVSFGFIVRDHKFTEGTDGLQIREIFDVELFEISPVIFPAFEPTHVEVGSEHQQTQPDDTILNKEEDATSLPISLLRKQLELLALE